MPQILVVEGNTDVAFFQELSKLLPSSLPESPFDFRSAEGKDNIPDIIRALLAADVRAFAVAKDIDAGSPEQTLQSIRGTVYSYLGLNPPRGLAQKRLEAEGRTISVIPMGLYQDDALKELGVTSHAMDDYLIKLLLQDPNLSDNVPELRSLLLQILPAIRDHKVPFNRSKQLFQLIKPIVQHGFNDTGAVHSLFEHANPDILRAVLSPLLADVELALVAQ
jgi:hypothetical protein